MRAFIVRHGNTFLPDEAPRRIGARTDLPLVEGGRAQARALAEHFTGRGIRFDRCLCSPLRRTRETAAIIAPYVEIQNVSWLIEIDHGPDENQTEAEMLARIGKDALDAWEVRAEPPPDWAVYPKDRLAAWHRWLEDFPTGNTLLVTSNGTARYARLALGLTSAKLPTGSYGEIERDFFDYRLISWGVLP